MSFKTWICNFLNLFFISTKCICLEKCMWFFLWSSFYYFDYNMGDSMNYGRRIYSWTALYSVKFHPLSPGFTSLLSTFSEQAWALTARLQQWLSLTLSPWLRQSLWLWLWCWMLYSSYSAESLNQTFLGFGYSELWKPHSSAAPIPTSTNHYKDTTSAYDVTQGHCWPTMTRE